jgi:hypothetical protein
VGALRYDEDIRRGALLKPDVRHNIYETIVVPTPQFYTVKYQATVWTQYMQHTNQIVEKLITSFLPQGQAWRVDTTKGYWFVGTVDGGSFEAETNFDDMSQQERFIKTNFTINVPAYFFATTVPGAPIPLKRYVSSPRIEFNSSTENPDVLAGSYVLGSDDPTLTLETQENRREDQRSVGWTPQKVVPGGSSQDPNDPALQGLPRGTYVPSTQQNYANVRRGHQGETVVKSIRNPNSL